MTWISVPNSGSESCQAVFAKGGRGLGRALGSEKGRVMEIAVLEYAAEERR